MESLNQKLSKIVWNAINEGVKPRTYDEYLEIFQQYGNWQDLYKNNKSVYQQASRRGYLKQLYKDLGWTVYKNHTFENCITLANSCDSWFEFMTKYPNEYNAAIYYGWAEEIKFLIFWADN